MERSFFGVASVSFLNLHLEAEGQTQINRIGRETGCHRCGTTDPFTASGNFIADFQPPRIFEEPKRLYPICLRCSRASGFLFFRHLAGQEK